MVQKLDFINENVQKIENLSRIMADKNCYLNERKSKSLTAYNVCYDCARDLISFQVDQVLVFELMKIISKIVP